MTTRYPSPPPNYANNNMSAQNDNHGLESSSTLNLDQPPNGEPSRHELTPYLRLSHILSLSWLAYPVISLLFVAYRLFDSTSNSQASIDDAKADLLTSCKAAETAASAAASMPRYLAMGTNDAAVASVNAAMDAAKETMVFSLTVVEAIINFIIDMYRSTFLCFLELVIRGGLALLIGAVQDLSSFVNTTLAAIRTSIQSDVSAANSVIQTAVSAINKVTSIVNVNLDVPQFSIPSLNSLANVTLPTTFEDALIALNGSLPSVDDLKNALDAVIDTPFEDVKADINSTFSNIHFNSSLFTVPPKSNLVFCDQMDTSFVDDLGHDIVKIARIGAGVIAAAAVLLILANMALEWYRWSKFQEHLEYMREAWVSDPNATRQPKTTTSTFGAAQAPTMSLTNHNLMIFLNNSESPLISRYVDQICAKLRFSQRTNTAIRFFFSYTTFPPALICLLIGAIGVLSVELQLAAIHPLEAHYANQASSSVSNFSSTITTQMNANMVNQSSLYANQVNSQILAVQNTLNNGVFGWVNVTTTTLNNTIVAFYQEIQDAVNATFGGTILDSPAQEFVKCMIGSKVDSIEEALTFLHNNLQVNFTMMSPNVLMLDNGTVNEIAAPIALAALGSPANSTTDASDPPQEGIVQKLITRYIAALKRERVMYLIFIGIWIFVALCAVGIIMWAYYGRPALREYRRRKYLAETGLPYQSRNGNAASGSTLSIWRAGRPDTRATPWVPQSTDRPDEKNGPARASFLQDAAVADAYLSSSSSNGDHTSNGTPYNASSNYPSRSQIHISEPNSDYPYQADHLYVQEPPSTADILRDFTPLQTPRTQAARNLQYEQESAMRDTNIRRLTVDSFMNYSGGASEDEKAGAKGGKWFGGLGWGAVTGKLRNDARRTTMQDPYAFDNKFGKSPSASNSQPHSQFDHSPAPETSGNGWFNKLAFWRQGKFEDESADDVLPQTHYARTGAERSVINLNDPSPRSHQNHQSLVVPPVTYGSRNFNLAPPPPPRTNSRSPPRTQNASPTSSRRGEDFPQSVQSVDGMLGFNASVPRSAAPINIPVEIREDEGTQLAYHEREIALPIHHQFIAHDMPVQSQVENPFGDAHSLEQRPRPDRTSFGPPGLYAQTNGSSRTLTPPKGHSRGQSQSHHRRTSSTPNANPFVTPFDDPTSPQRFAAPPTPSAFSTNSGPRAF